MSPVLMPALASITRVADSAQPLVSVPEVTAMSVWVPLVCVAADWVAENLIPAYWPISPAR